ncbi:MAG TPA: helix-turn-helix transcriptional regulator [Zeimonas sp.]|nr:helix-turn-helix transcriptional regulator [Zeimonas sp.]
MPTDPARFSGAVSTAARRSRRSVSAEACEEHDLERARAACERRRWSEAYRLLMHADASETLCADDLDRLATSAYLVGRESDFDRCLERAHREHARNGESLRAARCAFWRGLVLLLRGRTALANGWLARARRLVGGRDCAEQGYLLLPEAELQLQAARAAKGFERAARAAALGERFGDVDLATCARHQQGRARILQGRVDNGLALLDESMLAVVADELSPIMAGLVYCSVLDACQQVQAARRASEWTDALGRWCDAQPGLVAFTGRCLVHRAEILQMRGAWLDAMAEARRAARRGLDGLDREPPAAALYRQAELHRLRGDFDAADDAYRAAAERGFEPQPGLALLRLAQGRHEAARAGIRRALAETHDPLQRAKLLPARVEIALRTKEPDEARIACAELDAIARRFDTEVLAACAAQWQGAVALDAGDAHAGLAASRSAFERWCRLQAPYDAARVRVTIASACRALGDDEAADVEFRSAKAVFESLGAAPALAELQAFLHAASAQRPSLLTRREREVLRLVAAGRTNKAIAACLAISERTVDRHVGNILARLDAPSRAAATAIAIERKLL